MVAFVTLLCLGLGFLLLLKYLRSRERKVRAPGPKGLPIVGSAMQLTPGNLLEQFYVYAQRYGNIVELKILDSRTLVLNTTEMLMKAFSEDNFKNIFNNRPQIYFAEHFYFGGQSVTYKNPDKDHSNLRKTLIKGLHVYGDGVSKFEEIVRDEIQRVMGEIEKSGDEGFEVVSLVRRSLANIISVLMIGEKATNEDVQNFFDFIFGEDYFASPLTNALLLKFPSLRYTPLYKSEFEKVTKAQSGILEKYFWNMKKTWKPGTIRGLVDCFIEEQMQDISSNKEPLMTDERLQANLQDIISAGILTTAAVIPSIMLCLLNEPGYQTRIQEELDNVIGTNREPCVSDKHDCHFLEAVIMETMRYIPPVPFLLPHVNSTDTEFEGYHVDAGTVIVGNIWHIQHDKSIWGDPWMFRPERFLDESGKLLPSTHPLMKHCMPFGTGRRRCPGDSLARTRIFLYLAFFFQRWSFTPVPGQCWSSDPRVGKFDFDLTLKPSPFYCVARNRV